MSCDSTSHVSLGCHVTWLLPWWGSMFRKCVKYHRRHPAIPQDTVHARKCALKSSQCRYHCDWLPLWDSCWMEGKASHKDGDERKWSRSNHSWCWEEEAENDRCFKTIASNSFKEIKIKYAQYGVILYYSYNFQALTQRESRGYHKGQHFLGWTKKVYNLSIYGK